MTERDIEPIGVMPDDVIPFLAYDEGGDHRGNSRVYSIWYHARMLPDSPVRWYCMTFLEISGRTRVLKCSLTEGNA